MSPIEAVIYCEERECSECVVTINKIETRSADDISKGIPCLINLIRMDEKGVKNERFSIKLLSRISCENN